MKTTLTRALLAGAMGASLLAALPAVAAKSNSAGVQFVPWNLSGEVMPVPPYGSVDIAGSDVASKLIVNQPSGKVVQANITGVMNGLAPNTEYTVYLSNVYTPYVDNGWTVAGNWDFGFFCSTGCSGGPYVHNVSLTQQPSGTLSGSGSSGAYTWVIDSGSVSGTNVNFTSHYTATADATSPPTTTNVTGTIAPNGTMSGTWSDNYQNGVRTGTWSTSAGQATKSVSGSTGWPDLLTSDVQPFTFMTNDEGSGSWHVNLKGTNFDGFSAWVNAAGGTILISDSVTLN